MRLSFICFSISVDFPCIQANKLSTVKKCLNEVYKYGGPFTPRDLYPVGFPFGLSDIELSFSQYQLALHQIDSMRKDGKFVGVGGNIPEGQGIVMAHLNECHELLEMVRCVVLLNRVAINHVNQLKESMYENEDEQDYEDDEDEDETETAVAE